MPLAAALCAGFVLLRLVALEADFPTGITGSTSPYTDEGWYASAALAPLLSGSWYAPGDLNPAVNLPVLPFAQAAVLKLAGVGLFPARLTAVGFFALLALGIFALVRAWADTATALFATLLFATNERVFAYSRVALLEIPMLAFVVLAALAVTAARQRRGPAPALLAAACCAAAVLTKSTALFVLPGLVYLGWGPGAPRGSGRTCAIFLGFLALALLLHRAWAGAFYPGDYAYFTRLNFASWQGGSPPAVLANLGPTVLGGAVVGGEVYLLAVLLAAVLAVASPRFRRDRLLVACCLGLVGHWALFAAFAYQPPRYAVPIWLPTVVLLSLVCFRLPASRRQRGAALVLAGLLAVGITAGAARSVRSLARVEYSFRDMALDVGARMRASGAERPVLLGNFANSIGLVAGVPSVNDRLGTRELAWRIERYRPTHFVALGRDDPVLASLQQTRRLRELAAYDVFDNYSRGRRVHLFRLRERGAYSSSSSPRAGRPSDSDSRGLGAQREGSSGSGKSEKG